jgi:succinylglutamate desuccinylase
MAAERVLERIAREKIGIRGELVVLAGNLLALERGKRFIEHDLNRGWDAESVSTNGSDDSAPLRHENAERRELWKEIQSALAGTRSSHYFLDLHTTSAAGIPFAMAADGPANQAFAFEFPLPVFFGLIDRIHGTLLSFLAKRGVTVLGVEGGQNESGASVDHNEAVVWIALAATGMIQPESVPDLARFRDLLDRTRKDLPRAIEVFDRHAISPGDRFRMEPGFANIEPVRAGTLLARDRHGEIRAPSDCLLIMPLYQGLGDDGFFLGRTAG